jgi:uncharacterized protein (DUF2461 family)
MDQTKYFYLMIVPHKSFSPSNLWVPKIKDLFRQNQATREQLTQFENQKINHGHQNLNWKVLESEVLAVVRAKGAAHVFQHDQARRSIFFAQGFDELPERPKGAGAVALEAGASAGQ